MLQEEHSAILSTFIKLPFVIKIFVLSFFEWPLKTGFNVHVIAYVTSESTVSQSPQDLHCSHTQSKDIDDI